MPEYVLTNDQLRHIQYLLDEQQRLSGKIASALEQQQKLTAAILAVLAEVRQHVVAP